MRQNVFKYNNFIQKKLFVGLFNNSAMKTINLGNLPTTAFHSIVIDVVVTSRTVGNSKVSGTKNLLV